MRTWSSLSLSLRFGLCLAFALCALALLGPLLFASDASTMHLEREFCAPNLSNILGCDGFGIDLMYLLTEGARLSLFLSLSVTATNIFIGLSIGSLAAYGGPHWDKAVRALLDVLFAFPGSLLMIALAALLKPSLASLYFCLIVTGWTGYARLVRGEILALKEKEFVEAANALGLRPSRILLRHIWPNLISTLSVAGTFGIANTILAEASLSFLGLGLGHSSPSWGSLLFYGRDVILEAPHVSLFTGIAIVSCVLSFNLIGQGLKAQLGPRNI